MLIDFSYISGMQTPRSNISAKCSQYFGDNLLGTDDDGSPFGLVKANQYGEVAYQDSLSCRELGRILYAGINPDIKIAEDDRELQALMTIAKNTGIKSDKLGVYILRAVSLILQNNSDKGYNFCSYRGKIAEELRDNGIRAAIDAIRYWNPQRAGKGKKPAFSFLYLCIIRRMKGTLTKNKQKLLRRIRNAEKNGNLANPELYICLGAFTKENYFDGRKISDDVTDGQTFMQAHEYYNLLKQRAIARIRSKYHGDNKSESSAAAKDG